MRKISLFLFFCAFSALLFAQQIETSAVYPKIKNTSTNELYVVGENNTSSEVNTLYIGVVDDGANYPFNNSLLFAATSQISVDITTNGNLILNAPFTINNIRVDSGDFFTTANAFNYVYVTTLAANNITIPSGDISVLSNNFFDGQVSGKAIEINGLPMNSPAFQGKFISQAQVDTYTSGSSRIYYPWQDGAIPGSSCSDSCTDTCYQSRTVTYSKNIYNDNGASFKKIGRIKFSCKAKTFYSSGVLTSEGCKPYLAYYKKDGTLEEGFVGDTPIITIQENSLGFDAEPAAKCNLACTGTCDSDSAGEKYFAVNMSNNGITFNEVYAVDPENDTTAYCYGTGSSWPLGSGLNCKAKETVFDIYSLTCPEGSGELLKSAGEHNQYREVKCNQSSTISSEYAGLTSPQKNILSNNYFFFPSF